MPSSRIRLSFLVGDTFSTPRLELKGVKGISNCKVKLDMVT
jgi:hypothetical protein